MSVNQLCGIVPSSLSSSKVARSHGLFRPSFSSILLAKPRRSAHLSAEAHDLVFIFNFLREAVRNSRCRRSQFFRTQHASGSSHSGRNGPRKAVPGDSHGRPESDHLLRSLVVQDRHLLPGEALRQGPRADLGEGEPRRGA